MRFSEENQRPATVWYGTCNVSSNDPISTLMPARTQRMRNSLARSALILTAL